MAITNDQINAMLMRVLGEVTALRGEVTTLRGEVTDLRGELALHWHDEKRLDEPVMVSEHKKIKNEKPKHTGPKKPVTSFLMWLNTSFRSQFLAANPGTSSAQVATAGGKIWQAMSDDAKEPWQIQYRTALAEWEANANTEYGKVPSISMDEAFAVVEEAESVVVVEKAESVVVVEKAESVAQNEDDESSDESDSDSDLSESDSDGDSDSKSDDEEDESEEVVPNKGGKLLAAAELVMANKAVEKAEAKLKMVIGVNDAEDEKLLLSESESD